MELRERIKILRQDQGLSQTGFGQRLGVSRSVINNLERGVLINTNSIAPLVKLMAKEFSVSEEWLLSGVEPCPEYIPIPGTDMYQYLITSGATHMESVAICAYLNSDRAAREAFISAFRKVMRDADQMLREGQNPQT